MTATTTFRRHGLILSGVIATGFITGYLTRPPHPASANAGSLAEKSTRSRPVAPQEPSAFQQAPQPVSPALFSTDTIPDLLALHPGDLYPRLALWLIDAAGSDIGELFRKLMDHPEVQPRHFELLFTRWAATDPLGAIAAAKGTAHAHLPWSGWAKNQPLEALHHAKENHPVMLEWVLRSISETDPQLARSLLADHPHLPAYVATFNLIEGLAREDPQAAAELALENNYNHKHTRVFETWLRDDPHAAFAWFRSHRHLYDLDSLPDEMIATILGREHPALLAEFIATTPPGEMRRMLEASLFEQRALADPERALAEARANPSPKIVEQRLATLGVLQFKTDPKAARAIFDELLALNSDPLGLAAGSGTAAEQLIAALAKQDPQGVLTSILSASDGLNPSVRCAAEQWMTNDEESFAAWARQQTHPDYRQASAFLLTERHSAAQNYQAALSYIDLTPEEDRNGFVERVISYWHEKDPEAARAWAEEAGMMESLKESLRNPFEEP